MNSKITFIFIVFISIISLSSLEANANHLLFQPESVNTIETPVDVENHALVLTEKCFVEPLNPFVSFMQPLVAEYYLGETPSDLASPPPELF